MSKKTSLTIYIHHLNTDRVVRHDDGTLTIQLSDYPTNVVLLTTDAEWAETVSAVDAFLLSEHLPDEPAEVITEAEVLDPEAAWVECERGEKGCHGTGRAAEMVREQDGGWSCWSCYHKAQEDAEDQMRAARGY